MVPFELFNRITFYSFDWCGHTLISSIGSGTSHSTCTWFRCRIGRMEPRILPKSPVPTRLASSQSHGGTWDLGGTQKRLPRARALMWTDQMVQACIFTSGRWYSSDFFTNGTWTCFQTALFDVGLKYSSSEIDTQIFRSAIIRGTTLSLFVCRPGSVSVRETRFSRDKHLGTEGVSVSIIPAVSIILAVVNLLLVSLVKSRSVRWINV
jgi:hypothetical protein